MAPEEGADQPPGGGGLEAQVILRLASEVGEGAAFKGSPSPVGGGGLMLSPGA